MKNSASIAEAKAHFSALVGLAQRRKRSTVITRHGVPVAAIVPVDDMPSAAKSFSPQEIEALFRGLDGLEGGAVRDLQEGRR